MPGREHEAVAVEPVRVRRVVLHHLRVEQVGDRRERHRSARDGPSSPSGRASIESVRIVLMESWSSSVPVVAVLIRLPLSIRLAGAQYRVPPPELRARPPRSPRHRPRRGRARRSHASTAPGVRASRASSTARSRYRSDGARQAAPDHHVLGLEDVHVAGDRHAEHAREALEHPQGVGVAVARQRARAHAPTRGRPRRGRRPGGCPACRGRTRWRRARAPGRCSRPRGSRGRGSCPGHGGPSGSIVKWPSSAPRPCAPRKISPPITTPPPTPVPSVSITSTLAGASSTSCASASAAQLASLSTNTGTPEAAPELVPQRHARERDVHARLHGAGGVLDLRGHPHAHRRRAARPGRSPGGRWPRCRPAARPRLSSGVGDSSRWVTSAPADRTHGDLGAADVHAEHKRIGAHR